MHTQGLKKEKRSPLKIKCAQKIRQFASARAHTAGSNIVTFDSTSWTKAYFIKMKPSIKNINTKHI
jgi:hypothetical protein